MGLESVESKPQGTGSVDQSIVVTCERYGLTLLAEKVHRRQVKRIQRAQPELETAPGPARAPAEQARPTQHVANQRALASSPCERRETCARECGSRFHIQGAGWRSTTSLPRFSSGG